MVLPYKTSKFRSNLEMSVSSAIKDGKYCKANVTHIKMNSRNVSDNTSMLQLDLDSGKARELKARDSQFQKMVWVKFFFYCLLVYFIFNWRGRGVTFWYQEPSKSQEMSYTKSVRVGFLFSWKNYQLLSCFIRYTFILKSHWTLCRG